MFRTSLFGSISLLAGRNENLLQRMLLCNKLEMATIHIKDGRPLQTYCGVYGSEGNRYVE